MITFRILEVVMYLIAGAMLGWAFGTGLILIGDHVSRHVGW